MWQQEVVLIVTIITSSLNNVYMAIGPLSHTTLYEVIAVNKLHATMAPYTVSALHRLPCSDSGHIKTKTPPSERHCYLLITSNDSN